MAAMVEMVAILEDQEVMVAMAATVVAEDPAAVVAKADTVAQAGATEATVEMLDNSTL